MFSSIPTFYPRVKTEEKQHVFRGEKGGILGEHRMYLRGNRVCSGGKQGVFAGENSVYSGGNKVYSGGNWVYTGGKTGCNQGENRV